MVTIEKRVPGRSRTNSTPRHECRRSDPPAFSAPHDMDPSALLQYRHRPDPGQHLRSGPGLYYHFNTTGVINFAQGEFVMLGGMMSVYGGPRPARAGGRGPGRGQRDPDRGAGRTVGHPAGAALSAHQPDHYHHRRFHPHRGLAMLAWGKDTHALEPFSGSAPILFWARPSCPRLCGCSGSASCCLAG